MKKMRLILSFLAVVTAVVSIGASSQAQEKQITSYVKNNDRLAMVFDVNNRPFIDSLNNETFTLVKSGKFKSGEYLPDLNVPSCVIAHNTQSGFINGGVVDFDTASVQDETHYVGESLRVKFAGFESEAVMDCFKPAPGAFTDKDLDAIFGKLGEVFEWQKLNANEYNSKIYFNN